MQKIVLTFLLLPFFVVASGDHSDGHAHAEGPTDLSGVYIVIALIVLSVMAWWVRKLLKDE